MSDIADTARARQLTPDPAVTTGHGYPVLRGWRRLDEYIDPKLVGTDPTGQAWIIERVEASAGPAWLVWTVEDFEAQGVDAEPSYQSRRSDAVDYVSNLAALTERA